MAGVARWSRFYLSTGSSIKPVGVVRCFECSKFLAELSVIHFYLQEDESVMTQFKFLALSGSLRKASYNTAALNALKIMAPSHVEIVLGEIGELPLFNPDREGEHISSLQTLKDALSQSSGLILATPEYAHGISGPLKNALDWLVSGIEFPGKPIMLINTSPRAHYALDSLKEVLTTMSGRIIEGANVSIALLGSELDDDSIIKHKEISLALKTGLDKFCCEINKEILNT